MEPDHGRLRPLPPRYRACTLRAMADTAKRAPARPKRVRPTRFRCVICGKEKPARDITQLDVVRPSSDRPHQGRPSRSSGRGAISAPRTSTASARAMSPDCSGRNAANSPSSSRTWCRVSPTTRRWPKTSKPSGSATAPGRTAVRPSGELRRQLDLHHHFLRHPGRLDGVQRRHRSSRNGSTPIRSSCSILSCHAWPPSRRRSS